MDRIPVLEVFGNSKIIRNQNSSKFNEINNWFKNFKFYGKEKDNIFIVLDGKLDLGNIGFRIVLGFANDQIMQLLWLKKVQTIRANQKSENRRDNLTK